MEYQDVHLNNPQTIQLLYKIEAFSPSTLIVPVNTTVTWINKDPVTQNLVSDTGLFESGNLSNGQSFNYTFNQTGSYHYHSNIHPNIKGSINCKNISIN
ncbi:cupredoxin domain-containing protein [Methanobacterium spitsbergense]|uniref:Cupredoxin domain-containing protein n=1 Tax=Methanobacterium spitsbergense TaxID=2874285 RepID=A0A8T5V3T8_9EURY|nr:cupredoxin domain-containing protein [Methanobacterium spitsbergense]MBZ2166531.1 cupredoxin domain-containing protein [Methanobacterium spitsbergense]